jgi:TRAP-type C4-dicarboxylate transport system permease small subunit
MLARLNDWVTKALLVFAAVLAFLLCFLVVADVLGRVVFNSPV